MSILDYKPWNEDKAKTVTLLLLLNKAMEQLSSSEREKVQVTDKEIQSAIHTKEFPTRIICATNPADPLKPRTYKAVFSNNEIRKRTRVFDLT